MNQFKSETAITAQPGGLMYIMASSDLPVPLTCAGLSTEVIMALHYTVERERSKIAKCFPSTIQVEGYIQKYATDQTKIMSFDSVT